MVHLENAPGAKPEIKQVEFNTIASSFGGLSTQASKLYKYLMGQETYQSYLSPSSTSQDGLPLDSTVDAVTGLAQGIEYAHKCYLKHPSKEDNAPSNGNEKRVEGSKSAYCVLFIVQDGEANIFDQRHIEIRLSEQGIRVYRVIFDKVLAVTTVATDGTLHYHPPHRPDQNLEVTVIYYRAGYAPSEYTEPTAWKARHHLERSRAIKCPSVLTQLAGLKKVQQVLATPGAAHVEHFLDSNSNSSGNASVAAVRRTFAPMYPLDANSESGRIGCALATDASKATQFVLKPQREGGGNNVYRDAIPGFLAGLPQEQWEAHVLMEMIEPPAQRNVILRNGVVRRGAVICELGIYGACVWDQGAGGGGKEGSETEIFYNEKAGYLLRTKGSDSQEGGVAAGFGALDAPYLVDDEAVCS
jgi:glutathione synthase